MRFLSTGAVSALLGLLSFTCATDLTIYLPSSPNPFALPSSTHATLSSLHHRFSAPISTVNTFAFHNVTAGSYLLDVHCKTDVFQAIRVDVAADGSIEAWETFRGNDWDNKGEKLAIREGSAGRGVEARGLGSRNYFAQRPTFSVLTILKNPMILMSVASMFLVFGMPKLMESMDPEMKAEFEQRQKEGPMAMLGGGKPAENPLANFDMAAYLSGSKKKDTGSSGGNSGDSPKNQGVRR